MKTRLFSIVFALLSALTVQADDLNEIKVQADSAFSQENYDIAVKLYGEIAEQTESAIVCYNLGCSYYRLDNMAKSVLWFERARLLDPGNDDIRFNLEMARSKTIDKITPRHEIFFVSVYRSLVNIMNLSQWAILCITFFALALLALSLYIFSDRMAYRKAGFFASIIFFLLCVLGNVCAYQQRSFAVNRNRGIIMSSAVTVKSTPSDSGNDLFVLHEGTCVEIQDNTLKEWCEIQIADGKIGWIQKKVFEII